MRFEAAATGPETLVCPECGDVTVVSDEDQDASLSEAVRHMRSKHGTDTDTALRLLHGLE